MGKKLTDKKSKRYFTIMEALWKLGAPILVAIGKTVLESKVPFLK